MTPALLEPEASEQGPTLRAIRPAWVQEQTFPGVEEHPAVLASLALLEERWDRVERQLDAPVRSADRPELVARTAHVIGRCLSRCALDRQCARERIDLADVDIDTPQGPPQPERLSDCAETGPCSGLLQYPEAIAMRMMRDACWQQESELWACRERHACIQRDETGDTRACFPMRDALQASGACSLDGRALLQERTDPHEADYFVARFGFMVMAILGEAIEDQQLWSAIQEALRPLILCRDTCEARMVCASHATGSIQPLDALIAEDCKKVCGQQLESSMELFSALAIRSPPCMTAIREVERCHRDLPCENHLQQDRSPCSDAVAHAQLTCSGPLASLRPLPAPIPREAFEERVEE